MLTLLRRRNFALLWFAGLLSLVGDRALITALPFYVYQRTGSTLAEAVLAVAAYAVTWAWLRHAVQGAPEGTWFGRMQGGSIELTLTGWWLQLVALPLYWFLFGRWVWRFGTWGFMLYDLSRCDLRLVATHPDRCGGLAFIVVYREVFETVLFYAALWTQDNGVYLLAGLASGVVILAAVAAVLLRSAARLPISQFFAFSSALVGALAVVLMGKGVAALQKVGVLQITPLSIPRIDVLGVYPSIQTVTAQVLILLIIVASVAYNLRSQRAATQS